MHGCPFQQPPAIQSKTTRVPFHTTRPILFHLPSLIIIHVLFHMSIIMFSLPDNLIFSFLCFCKFSLPYDPMFSLADQLMFSVTHHPMFLSTRIHMFSITQIASILPFTDQSMFQFNYSEVIILNLKAPTFYNSREHLFSQSPITRNSH